MSRCGSCQYGRYDKLSDICDGCRNEPDVGWFGYTDNATGRHYNSKNEEHEYYMRTGYDYHKPWEHEKANYERLFGTPKQAAQTLVKWCFENDSSCSG